MRHSIAVLFLAVLFTCVTSLVFAEQAIDDSTKPRYMLVLSATSGSIEGDILTLNGVPNVLYFTDRPQRITGHMSLNDFVEIWSIGEDNFNSDPPNAALSMLTKDGAKNIVVKLISSQKEDDSIIFKIELLKGDFSGSFETATIYVDPDTVAPMITG